MMWSLTEWINSKDPATELKQFQDEVMNLVQINGDIENTMVDGEVNQWHFHNPDARAVKTPTLLIHGYAASSMAYYRTFQGLSDNIRDLYAIDLPSNGLSKEIPFILEGKLPSPLKVEVHKDGSKFKIIERMDSEHCRSMIRQYENYYLDSIERWRKYNGIDRFNLIGHSFGGYIAFRYAVKYPRAVERLGLISPLGVESNIYSVNNDWELDTVYEMELTDPASRMYGKNWQIPKILFERQTDLLRWLGPLGAKLCWNYISTAYDKLPTMEYKNYIFNLLYGNGGIRKTSKMLFTGIFTRSLLAKDPIMDSIDKLNSKKVLLLYGDKDWMNAYAGYRMVQLLNQKRGEGYATYDEVPDARHNLFLDNPNSFNDKLVRFLSE